mmetsp:Transcript_8163/g.11572  ORF Transcript_8163/g.11572 Transcript_8163/m.11572 type:complete len:84 (-) Transcript_8163:796-1047(-)
MLVWRHRSHPNRAIGVSTLSKIFVPAFNFFFAMSSNTLDNKQSFKTKKLLSSFKIKRGSRIVAAVASKNDVTLPHFQSPSQAS